MGFNVLPLIAVCNAVLVTSLLVLINPLGTSVSRLALLAFSASTTCRNLAGVMYCDVLSGKLLVIRDDMLLLVDICYYKNPMVNALAWNA